MSHRLVVNPAIEIALQSQKVAHILTTPARPIMRGEHHVSFVGEKFNALVYVLRPVQRITHERATDRHQIMHGVRAIFCHT